MARVFGTPKDTEKTLGMTRKRTTAQRDVAFRLVVPWPSVFQRTPLFVVDPAPPAVSPRVTLAVTAAGRKKEIAMLWFLVVGVIAGFLAGKIMRGKGFGIIGDLVVGIIGAMLGGWVFGLLGIHSGGLIGSIITATVGAVLLVAIVRAIF